MKTLRIALIAAGLLLAAGAVYAMVAYLMHPAKVVRPKVQNIAVLRQAAPPPPPKPEEKPPEPEIRKEEVKLPDPDPAPKEAADEPPPAQDLGVDAQGGAGGDSFGLVGRPGGRDITTIGAAGDGSGKSRFALFTQLIQAHLQEEFAKNKRLRDADYRVQVRVWFALDGRIDRFEIASSTGNAEIDESLRVALTAMPPLKETLPADMPQPVRLRVTARGAG
ncbi:MAG: TonB C-terminal domain-containing protein [Burkholderiales bacterium]